MRHTITRTALCVVGALVIMVPAASADTTSPVWTCRASPAYVENTGLLGTTRVEPLVANGVANAANPDRASCANADTGVQDTSIPPSMPLVTVNAASGRTTITPEIGAARDQAVTADAKVTETTITLGELTIVVGALESSATARCSGTTAQLDSPASTVASLTINGTTIDLDALKDLPSIPGLLNIDFDTLSQSAGSLTRRALVIELVPSLALLGTKVVIGEVKVGNAGDVCAAAPPPASCPAGTVPQNPGGDPLTCVLTVTAPCPAGSTADPNRGGACVIVTPAPPPPPAACPTGSLREPQTGACIVVLQRPCPAGAVADPQTRVCVVTAPGTTGSSTTTTVRENGRIGSPTGPRATCGKVSMRFVRGGGRTLTNRLGIRVVTRGRVVSCERRPRPIVGARIDVIHVLPDGRRLRKTGLRSRGDGKLTLILPNDVRSRKVEYAYRPNLSSTRVSSKRTLSLTVRNRAGRVIR